MGAVAKRNWLWLAAFIAVYCALRVFWLDCDTGIPATWEYGYHTTDEGYYLCGGKEMLVRGSFVDVVRREAQTYCYSYGTHWLSYLAHLVFGLSTWAWRLPFAALYLLGWLMLFRHVARKSGGAFAFAACTAMASLPLVVTYERSASNDALISALLAIAYVLACGKGRWRLFAAAAVTAAIGTVKPAVWAIMPMVLGGVLETPKTRSRLWDAAIFVGVTVAAVGAFKGLSALSVVGEAQRAGMSVWEVLRLVNATYGLPSVADLFLDLRAVASFPRDPSIRIMGGTAVLISAVPAAMFLVGVLRRRWNGHLFLYGAMAAYAYALNVINSMYSHYFLPILVMLPVAFSAFCEDCGDLALEKPDWGKLAYRLVIAVAVLALVVLGVASLSFDLGQAAGLYSRIYNLPAQNPWRMTWPLVAATTLAGVGWVAWRRGRGALLRFGWAWGAVFFLAGSAAFAALPAAVIAPRMRLAPELFYLPLGVNLAAGMVLVYCLFAETAAFSRRWFAAAALAAPIVASYLVLPTWRDAATELFARREYRTRDVALELAKLVPEDAIVLGERSSQVLMSLPIRAASLFSFNSEPQPLLDALFERDPDAKLYGFFDSQHAYCLQNMRKCADKYSLVVVKEFKMPSFGNGKPASVYLCRILRTPQR